MTPQQARAINIVQWTLAILLVANVVAELRSPEWEAMSNGLASLLLGLFVLSLAYRVQLETGRWHPSLLLFVGCLLVAALAERFI